MSESCHFSSIVSQVLGSTNYCDYHCVDADKVQLLAVQRYCTVVHDYHSNTFTPPYPLSYTDTPPMQISRYCASDTWLPDFSSSHCSCQEPFFIYQAFRLNPAGIMHSHPHFYL